MTFHGAAGTVTGSCTAVRNGDRTVLVGCGLLPELAAAMVDGRDYWVRVIDFDAMVAAEAISPADRDLIHWVDGPDMVWQVLASMTDLAGGAPDHGGCSCDV